MAFIHNFDTRGTFVDSAQDTSFVPHVERGDFAVGGSRYFWIGKRVFDIVFSLLLLPVLVFCTLSILALNPFLNRGRLFFVQARMGQDCRAFPAIKFRTMTARDARRGPDDPIETDRITPLGRVLRKARIDELPQILNVLRGDMSLIGPRPDYFGHARAYVRRIPQYRERHAIRPGISGLAQTEVGYVEGTEATRRKVQADMTYIAGAGMRMDLWVFWRTLVTVFRGYGA